MQATQILIVDDDLTHRNMLLALLTDWGHITSGAQNGLEAVELCRNYHFDLVIMDVRMPKLSGVEALKQIQQCAPGTSVLIMTAYSAIEDAVEAIKLGAYDYLTKPLDFEKLKVTLQNMFAYKTLLQENKNLQSALQVKQDPYGMIGNSKSMLSLFNLLDTVAPTEATVLIAGESGTGKELVAKAIHSQSERREGPFIAVNCAALSESLLESELFGHEKGAFTGADKKRDGRFITAHNGTIFLDEIGEMPLAMQAKLLRVIQEREVQQVGSDLSIPVNVRILAATNKDLEDEVKRGDFREDLFYRLNVVTITVPPLRERPEDIPLLAQFFAKKFAAKNHKYLEGFSQKALDLLLAYCWPGNVRELENCIERAIILLAGTLISERELPPHLTLEEKNNFLKNQGKTLDEIEKQAILQALDSTDNNKSAAAKILGITRKTLHAKLQRYKLA